MCQMRHYVIAQLVLMCATLLPVRQTTRSDWQTPLLLTSGMSHSVLLHLAFHNLWFNDGRSSSSWRKEVTTERGGDSETANQLVPDHLMYWQLVSGLHTKISAGGTLQSTVIEPLTSLSLSVCDPINLYCMLKKFLCYWRRSGAPAAGDYLMFLLTCVISNLQPLKW